MEKKAIPHTWPTSRMSLIYKGKGDKTIPSTYRPITATTSILNRVGTQAIKFELEQCVEENRVQGELENEFRKCSRLDDNLFVLSQCIEVEKMQNRSFWLAFLDIEAPCDNVRREQL